jgi:hypothetical protein
VVVLWRLNLSEYTSQIQLFTDVLRDFRIRPAHKPVCGIIPTQLGSLCIMQRFVRTVAKLLGCLDCGVGEDAYVTEA